MDKFLYILTNFIAFTFFLIPIFQMTTKNEWTFISLASISCILSILLTFLQVIENKLDKIINQNNNG